MTSYTTPLVHFLVQEPRTVPSACWEISLLSREAERVLPCRAFLDHIWLISEQRWFCLPKIRMVNSSPKIWVYNRWLFQKVILVEAWNAKSHNNHSFKCTIFTRHSGSMSSNNSISEQCAVQAHHRLLLEVIAWISTRNNLFGPAIIESAKLDADCVFAQ